MTHYEVLEQFGTRASLLNCRLETGRTHQIRIHLAEIDHPVVGDPVYGPQETLAIPRAVSAAGAACPGAGICPPDHRSSAADRGAVAGGFERFDRGAAGAVWVGPVDRLTRRTGRP